MTLPEVLLWQRFRGKPSGIKFRRQHAVGPYVVDFFVAAEALVIEVDGMAHDGSVRQGLDAQRDAYLAEVGLRVVRIAAAEVLRDPDAAAASILACVAPPLHQPAAGPPPPPGEDLGVY